MEGKIFLLGGHDLEMQEIAALLKQCDFPFFNRNLSWSNANLSAYSEELQQYSNQENVLIYGIELQDDGIASTYRNYVRVDHHNDYSGRPSSLEQVARIIGVDLTWRQKLIAANDSGYIPAMQQLGASPAEIAEIRLADRKMQGCTPEDECLAEQSIRSELERTGDLIIVKSFTSRFSPLCDRLWPYRKLLIYTEDSLCYYGQDKEKLVKQFAPEIASGKMYHGGGDNGFFGVAEGNYSAEEILQFVQVCKGIVVQK